LSGQRLATGLTAAGQDLSCPACGFPIPTPARPADPPIERCNGCGGLLANNGSAGDRNSRPAPAPKRQRLNAAQEAAVTTQGNCLVTACPGSGKTFVLRERAIRKLQQHPDTRGIAVTFTRDAARELESRVLQAYPDGGHRLICGTFHSLCKRQLEDAGIKVNLVNEVQQTDLMRRAWNDIMRGAKGINFDQARMHIESIKSSLRTVMEDPSVDVLAAIYYRYQELLRQLDAMDFSDMLVETTKGMFSGRVPPLEGSFLLVDEAQDSDPAQMGWANAYLDKGVEVTVVGDDDQSIYSWRFAMGFEGMEQFRHRARATHISLDTTYRCAREIVVPASRLIERNKARIPKQLRTENLDRGKVKRIAAASRDEEIEQLVEAVLASGRPGDWGILGRTNKLVDRVETLIAGRFPVTRSGGKSFWDMRWPSIYLGLCRSICFDDMVGVDAALRLAGIGERRLSELHNRFQSRNRGSLSKFVAGASQVGAGDPEGYFRYRAQEWRGLLERGKMELVALGVGAYMKDNLMLAEPGARNRDEQVQSAGRMIDAAVKVLRGMRGGLGARLNALQREQDGKDDGVEESVARLMTFHGSKGLEFENVWIVGCEEGVIPAKGAPEEEERRLFYVGMTRAKQLLVLSHSEAPPSPFLKECGALV